MTRRLEPRAGSAATLEPPGEIAQPRGMTAGDLGPMVEVMVRAFFDDPIFGWVLPDEQQRTEKLRWLGERWLRARMTDEILVTDPAAALLVGVDPAGHADVPFWTQVKLGILAMPFVFGAAAFRRFLAVEADVKKRHAEELTGPQFVIDILCVDPPLQGRGLGTGLAGTFLARVDRERLPCYLITHKARNVPFYQRLGFEVIRETRVPPSDVVGWSMRRPSGAISL
jgi:GNAT superfamily N-acetyltransferase